MTYVEHFAQCGAHTENSPCMIHSEHGADPEQCGPILRAGPAQMQHCPASHFSLLSLPENFLGRCTNPGMTVAEAEAPGDLPLLPHWSLRAIKRSTFFTCLSSWPGQPMLWQPGGRTLSTQKTGRGRGCQCLPPPAPAGIKQKLSGWFHFLVSRDLSVWFHLKTQRGSASIQNKRNSRICLYPLPITTITKEWYSE